MNERPTFLDGLRDDLVTGRDRLRRRRRRARRVVGASATVAAIVGGVVLWPGDDPDRPFVATEEPSTTADPQPAPSSSTTVDSLAATTSTAVGSIDTTAEGQALRQERLSPPPLEARSGHTVVWTGREVIAWGGWRDDLASVAFGDGAAYDPAAGTWRTIAAAPIEGRGYHVAAWTGTEMIVVGGQATGLVGVATGAAYDPATDTWRRLPDAPTAFPTGSPPPQTSVWADGRLTVWLGRTDEVFALDPREGTWATLPPTGLPAPDYRAALRWTGSELVAMTGPAAGPQHAARLFRGRDAWEQLPPLEFSTACCSTDAMPENSAVVDEVLVVWSGRGGDAPAFALDPGADAWREIAPVPLGSCAGSDLAVAIEHDLVAIGNCGGAGRYSPATDTWTPIADDPDTASPLQNTYLADRFVAWTGAELVALVPTCCFSPPGPHHEWDFVSITLPADSSGLQDPGAGVHDLPLSPVGEDQVPATLRAVLTDDAVIVAAYRIGDTDEVLTLTSSDDDPSTYCVIPPDFRQAGAMCVEESTGGLSGSRPNAGDVGWAVRIWVDVETPASIEQSDGVRTYRQQIVRGISVLPIFADSAELTVRTFDANGVVLDERTE